MKKTISLLILQAALAAGAAPVATISSSAFADGKLTVTYSLMDGPAVVTFDVETNATGDVWASIGGAAVTGGIVSGNDALWRKVTETGPFTVCWRPDAWKGSSGSIRAVVRAWPLDNPPDYLVADLSAQASAKTPHYYPGADFVPGGVLGNVRYRQTALLMRKVMAKDVTWTTGNTDSKTTVKLDDNYYMGVFEVTKAQWALMMNGKYPTISEAGSYKAFTNPVYREMRPMELASYNEIRTSGVRTTYNAANDAPNAPHGNSFLGKVRNRTGINFDLPSVNQWEYACRAGHGEGYWGDGTVDDNKNDPPGRYNGNGGTTSDFNCDPNHGTAICGSYPPNSWGIYDMHGNLYEFCTDTATASASNPSKYKLGGSWSHGMGNARPAHRNSEGASTQWHANGFRVMCPVAVP